MSRKGTINISGILATIFILISIFALADPANAAGTAAATTIDNQASTTYQDANTNSYSASSNTVTTTVNSVYSVTISAPVDKSGGSNTVVYYAYTVTNTSNTTATFDLTDTEVTWTGTIYADDGAGGGTANDGVHHTDETTVTASTGSLAADATYQFFLAVTIPQHTANATTDDTTLNVAGTGAASGATTSDQVTTTANAPALSVVKRVRNFTDAGSFATTATADPNETLEYRIAVTNSGSVQATVVALTDSDHANTTYVASQIRIGSSATCSSNALKSDTTSGDATCGTDACGAASFDGSGNLTAFLGNNSTESAGGTLAASSTVYVCFQVTVD